MTMALDLTVEGKGWSKLTIPHSSHESAYGQIEVPVGIVQGGAGPTVLLVAGNHGDEFEGQFALRRLFRDIDPHRVTGRIVLVPAANPPAVRASTRTSPLDQGNLNRLFPGDALGGPTAEIAYAITNELLPAADYLVDLHSGGSSLEYLPSTIIQRTDDRERDLRQQGMASAFGAPRILIYDALPGIARSLSGTAIKRGILSIATELGGGGSCTPATLEIASEGIASLLGHLGVLDGAPARGPGQYFHVDTGEDFLRSPDHGFFEPSVALGDEVQKGQLAGFLHRFSELGEAPLAVHFPAGGQVVCRRTYTGCGRGDCLFHTARCADRPS